MFVMKQLNIRFADKKNYTKLTRYSWYILKNKFHEMKRRNTLYYAEHLK